MQYTNHYHLNLPEGTDIVNPLVQDNPNYTAIDTAMYENKLRVIGTATELTTGTVHALTRADQDIPVFRFVATSDFNTGDTFAVDGVSVTARRADGSQMKNKAYLINSTVLCILDGTILNFIGVDGISSADNVSYDNTGTPFTSGDVQDVITEIGAMIDPGGKYVTATGSQSWTALLNSLFGELDLTKIGNKSRLVVSSGATTYVLHIASILSNALFFGGYTEYAAGVLYSRIIKLASTGSFMVYRANDTDTVYESQLVPSGTNIIVFY